MFFTQNTRMFRKLFRNICQSCHEYNDKITCCLIPGDGIGPELIDSVQKVFEETSIPVNFEVFKLKNHERSVADAIDKIKKYGICIKTPFKNYEPTLHGEYQNLNIKIRLVLDAYANIAHFVSIPGIATRHKDVDFYIVREQTESSYTNLEHQSVKGVVASLKVVTWKKSWRIAKFAFDFATKLKRKTVTCVHKANIMKLTDGLFLRCCNEVSKLYPRIKFNNLIVDNTMMQLVSKPQQFDVMLTPNLYGNIADNLAAGLVGGAGLVPGASYASQCVIFEPVAHHTFHRAAGKNIANPTATLLCAAKMLIHVNQLDHAQKLKESVYHVLKEGKVRTCDIGGKAGTTEFTDAVIKYMKG